jgi:Fe-S cluster assembly protein SufD
MVQEPAIPLYEEVVNGYNRMKSGSGTQNGSGAFSGSESSGIRRARESAFEKFRERGFPTIKNEDWKYTNIVRFLKDKYELTGAPVPDSKRSALLEEAAIGSLDCYRIVLVNGSWQRDISTASLPSGVLLLTVAEAKQDPVFADYFERKTEDHHFTALNAALFTDGIFIRVDANAVPDKPLHIVHVYSSDCNLLVQPRHVVIVNRNAALTIIESVVSSGEPVSSGSLRSSGESVPDPKILANSFMEIMVEPDAQLEHIIIQTARSSARLIQHTTVRQRRQSAYNNFTLTLPGSDLVRNELHVRMEEEYAECHLYGLYLTGGHQLVDNHTLVDHQKPSCQSNELYKGVLLERSTGVFNGKIYVHKDAQKTNAFQQNNNLVISKMATIDSKPQLEIFADDVKCSHGSTVGQFSEEALFYLRSRGIGEDTAKSLLINAFAFDVTEKIRIPALRTHINDLIGDHIPAVSGEDRP